MLIQVIYQLYGEPNPLNRNYNTTSAFQTGGPFNPYSSTEANRYSYDTFNRDRFNNNVNKNFDDEDDRNK